MHKTFRSLTLIGGVAAVSAAAVSALATGLPAAPPAASPAPAYVWKNVAIGGGGYVLDVVCHPKERDLVYIRTDVGGFYRWDPQGQGWTPITDGFRRHESNYYGGEGLALDPSDPDVVYIAGGKYVADWAPKGAIFKSTDRGRTWRKLGLEVKMGGNEHYRVCGQRLVVSPSDPKLLLFGSRRDGLQRSGDGGETWTRVGGFSGRESVGVTAVAFAPDRPGVVFAATFGDGVWRSEDGGKTWTKTLNGPAEVLRLVAAPDGAVYATHEKGVAKWSGGKWADVTPAGGAGPYAGLSVNPRDARDVIAAAQKDSLHLYRSKDGGATWERKRTETRSSVPWYPGHMKQVQYTSGLTFDPQAPGRVWLTDWYATYRGNLDADPLVLESRERGHEEVVVFSLAAPAGGALPLVSGVADVDGFPHESLDAFPGRGLGAYYGGSGTAWGDCYQVSFCPTEPLRLARVGGRRWDNTGGGSVSADGGKTWTDFPTWDNKVIPARVALSAADPKNLVVLRIGPGPALFTRDGGKTWKESAGLPGGLVSGPWNWQVPLAADGAKAGVFYAFSGGTLYKSADGGATFAPAAKGLPAEGQQIVASVPGRPGEVWLSLQGGGLRRSTDGGATFAAVPAVKGSHLFALGKAAPGRSEPALYLYGALADGRDGIFRSLDGGKSWASIQDPRVPIGNEPNSMAASFDTFGRVFIGTNGRGIYYGEPAPARTAEAKR